MLTLQGIPLAQQRTVPESGYRDWKVYGGGPESVRYSALDQINRENVVRLEVAWIQRDILPFVLPGAR